MMRRRREFGGLRSKQRQSLFEGIAVESPVDLDAFHSQFAHLGNIAKLVVEELDRLARDQDDKETKAEEETLGERE